MAPIKIKRPTVSIIIPNYNHALFLPKRIDSILNQTWQDFEVIILDDASTDSSREVIEYYCKMDNRISTVYNDCNSGSVFKQWNKGVARAKGDYIWIAESDDWSDCTFLQEMVILLHKNPNVGIAFCNSHITNAKGEILTSTEHRDPNHLPGAPLFDSNVVNGKEFFFYYFVLYNEICNVSSAIFRKSIYIAAGGADERMRNAGDWMLYFKMLMISDLAYLNEHLNYWRRHSGATTNDTSNVRRESLHVVKECIKYQRKNGLKVSKKSLESNFIWSFQRAYWIKPPIYNLKSFYEYFKQAQIDEIRYLVKYHGANLFDFLKKGLKNRYHILKCAIKSKVL